MEKYHLLVVDDEPTVCQGILRLIDWNSYGFETLDCSYDGCSAFEKALKNKYELVITDVCMPGMNGLELIQKLQQYGCCENFLVLSAYADFEYVREALRYGARDYLLKPIDTGKLNSVVRRICDLLRDQKVGSNTIQKSYQESLYQIGILKCLVRDGDIEGIRQWFGSVFIDILNDAEGKLQGKEFCRFVYEKIKEISNPSAYDTEKCDWSNPEALRDSLENECRLTVLSRVRRDQSENPVEMILQYIRQNYKKDITLCQIAAEFFMNPAYLGRLFHTQMQMSFNDYLNAYRIDQASVLLRDKQKMVYEIGAEVGYGDLNYFYKVFKKKNGITPSEYRSRYLRNNNQSD